MYQVQILGQLILGNPVDVQQPELGGRRYLLRPYQGSSCPIDLAIGMDAKGATSFVKNPSSVVGQFHQVTGVWRKAWPKATR